ncbi:MAG: DUF2059 domain-containing protein [Victivallales bacterium]|nr:DUF2059 domain-containing protein [Victivallales bacterium]
MLRTTIALMLFLGIFAFTSYAQNPHTDEEYEVCYQLFEIMEMDKTMKETANKMVGKQLNALPKETLQKIRPVVVQYLEKYLNYESVKQKMADVYLKYFAVNDIKELIKFYQTPVGQKFIKNQSQLMVESAEIGTKQVTAHQAELQQMLIKAMQE